ncbi:MAG: cation:proton antiporter [Actinobacteria bacterium]|nr:cation:proton antiporter [Actinomycetota bacterium]
MPTRLPEPGARYISPSVRQAGLVALGLLVVVATLLALAPTVRIPYPILLVVGGLAIGLVPGMPDFELEPELVFFGVLPPLLYGAAFFTSLRDLRANVRPIGLLAIGLVVMTTVVVAVVTHAVVDGLTWPAAFVLGAIVSRAVRRRRGRNRGPFAGLPAPPPRAARRRGAAVLELRRTGLIGNDVWLSVSRDLDLEDERLDS